ncbi:LamB/YcsF family protein [Desertibaculum subflavum]|uniref:LamB/YcsF family protein n=1 Tax=Desertibaculum subflavum TaxID=2268458 RepID=UPI000E675B89
MNRGVDLNSDMGESFAAWKMGDDEAMLKIVTSANVACGFHAGDPNVMAKTAAEAKQNGVDIGAHPGFNDIAGFGRRQILGDSPAEIERMIAYQIGALQAVAALVGHKVSHVKAHGALSNLAAVDEGLARSIARGIKGVDRDLLFVVMPMTALETAGEKEGLKLAREVFADRAYDDSGNLVSRKLPGAMIHDAEQAAARAVRMVEGGAIECASGKRLKVDIDTICVHGDSPTAVAMARAVKARLESAGVPLRRMREIVG